MFFFLISVADQKLGKEKIDQILESPDHSGETVFGSVSYLSEKISGWILDRNIDVAFVNFQWLTPIFWFKSNFERMLEKGINPFVVNFRGKSEFEKRNFENIDKKLLEPFLNGKIIDGKTHACYSFNDSVCNENCKKSCEDKMLKSKLYTRKINFENEKRGGEGFVCFGTWHQKPVAFKLLGLGKIENVDRVPERILNAEKTRAEFVTASKLSHPNILKVVHLFRYQETEKIGNYRLLQNWTVIVMQKHEKNIGELFADERNYLPLLFRDVLGLIYNII